VDEEVDVDPGRTVGAGTRQRREVTADRGAIGSDEPVLAGTDGRRRDQFAGRGIREEDAHVVGRTGAREVREVVDREAHPDDRRSDALDRVHRRVARGQAMPRGCACEPLCARHGPCSTTRAAMSERY
jgi:hypothetical protein